MEYVLRTNKLVKIYKGKKALRNVSMNVARGDIYGFVGENGSGKTTVIRTVTGLISPKSGSYELFGVKATDKNITSERKKVAAIVESPSIYKNFSAKENILMQATILGVECDADKILRMVGLEAVINDNKKAGNFSLGMRQRLGIAMCLINNPEILILDEPMNGLDPAGIVDLRELILKLNKEKNITFIISSHILTELQLVATKYGLITKGVLIKEITKEELENELTGFTIIETENPEDVKAVLLQNEVNEEYINVFDNKIKILNQVDINSLIKILADNQININSINCSKMTIEEYYLNTIGGRHNG